MTINSWFWKLYAIVYKVVTESIPHQELMQKVIDNIPRQAEILDAGCGTGALLGNPPRCLLDYTGIDNCKAMIDLASKQHPNRNFRIANLDDLRLQERYSAVTCINAIYAVKDPQGVLNNLNLATKNGGKLYLVVAKKSTGQFALLKYDFWTRLHRYGCARTLLRYATTLPQLYIIMACNIIIGLNRKQRLHFYEKDKWIKSIEQAGYHVERCESVYVNKAWLFIAKKEE